VQGQRVRSWLVASCLAACGGPSKPVADELPTPTQSERRSHQPLLPETAAAPRPEIRAAQILPDLDAEARWPLGFNEHPIDEPSFDIAGALAEPGIGWRELCARGVQFGHRAKDQDLIRYLKAWCTQDATDALYQLGLLQSSPIRGIADAIVHDAARIVAGRVSGEDAEGALIRARLLDSDTVDLVAASYYEIGKVDDALAMDKVASNAERTAHRDATCHRLVRAIASTTGVDQDAFIAKLHALATPPKDVPLGAKVMAPDPTCIALDAAVACSRAADACTSLTKGDPKLDALLAAYSRWPKDAAPFGTWYEIIGFAGDAMPSEDAVALLDPAVELAMKTSQCRRDRLDRLAYALREIDTLHTGEPHSASVAAMLERLNAFQAQCR
jgi:hypothetical protein